MSVIFCNGVFDGCHAGHFNFLQFAGSFVGKDDRLIVAIDSDEKVSNTD